MAGQVSAAGLRDGAPLAKQNEIARPASRPSVQLRWFAVTDVAFRDRLLGARTIEVVPTFWLRDMPTWPICCRLLRLAWLTVPWMRQSDACGLC